MILHCRHEAERVREKTWDHLSDRLPLVATRPNQGLSEALWDDHCHRRRAGRARCEKGRLAGRNLCAGVLPLPNKKRVWSGKWRGSKTTVRPKAIKWDGL